MHTSELIAACEESSSWQNLLVWDTAELSPFATAPSKQNLRDLKQKKCTRQELSSKGQLTFPRT